MCNGKKYKIIILLLIAAAFLAQLTIFCIQLFYNQDRSDFFNIRQTKDKKLRTHWGDFYEQVLFIKEQTPKDSLIILPPKNEQFEKIGNEGFVDYFIFPRQSVHNNNKARIKNYQGSVYRVNMPGFRPTDESKEGSFLDSNFSILLVRKGTTAKTKQLVDFNKIKTTFKNAALALIKLILIIMVGAYIVAKFFKERSLLSFFTTSFLVGIIISAVCYICFSIVKIDFIEQDQFLLLSIASIPGIIILIKERYLQRYFQRVTIHSKLATVAVTLFFILLFLKSMSMPIIGWDGCVIWGIKAKSIFALKNLEGLKYWGAYPSYPPLLPVLMSFMAVGGEPLVKLLFPLLSLCLYVNIRDEINDTGFSTPIKTLFPLFIFLTPLFLFHSIVAYANLICTVYVTKALTIFIGKQKEASQKSFLGTCIILCGAILSRPDGIAWSLIVAMLFFYQDRQSLKNNLRSLWILLPTGVFLLWKIYFISHLYIPIGIINLRASISHFLNNIHGSTASTILKVASINFMEYAFSIKYYGFIPIIFVFLLLTRWKSMAKHLFPECIFVFIGAIGLFMFMPYAVQRWGVIIFDIGFVRYMMPVIPIMFIIIIKECDFILKDLREYS